MNPESEVLTEGEDKRETDELGFQDLIERATHCLLPPCSPSSMTFGTAMSKVGCPLYDASFPFRRQDPSRTGIRACFVSSLLGTRLPSCIHQLILFTHRHRDFLANACMQQESDAAARSTTQPCLPCSYSRSTSNRGKHGRIGTADDRQLPIAGLVFQRLTPLAAHCATLHGANPICERLAPLSQGSIAYQDWSRGWAGPAAGQFRPELAASQSRSTRPLWRRK
jgi:hypothetical protein